jgi:endonuclease/exonuclease/phosphatase family metal-dependent hydrolase
MSVKTFLAGLLAGAAVAALAFLAFADLGRTRESTHQRQRTSEAHAPSRGDTPPIWGPPEKSVRIVSYNILHNQRGMTGVLDEIRRERPVFVLLQEVEKRELSQMSEALNMLPAAYHASTNLAGAFASWGNAILSTHPLSDARSIPNPGGGSFGVWATAVVDDTKFMVASVHLSATWKASPSHLIESSNNRWKELSSLVKAWEEAGAPPIVVGGDFNQLAIHNNYALMTKHWRDALKELGKGESTFSTKFLRTRIDYFLVSKEWRVLAGGVGTSEASDHRAIWVEVGK